MLTLKFQNEKDLSNFIMVTGLYKYPVDVDYGQLEIQGKLPEAETELACNAFDAELTSMALINLNNN